MKKFLALALAALLLLSLVACGKDDDNTDSEKESAPVEEIKVYNNFEYGVNEEGNLEIIGFVYTGSERLDVTVPSEIGGRPVTGIGDNAFNACMTIQSIVNQHQTR